MWIDALEKKVTKIEDAEDTQKRTNSSWMVPTIDRCMKDEGSNIKIILKRRNRENKT